MRTALSGPLSLINPSLSNKLATIKLLKARILRHIQYKAFKLLRLGVPWQTLVLAGADPLAGHLLDLCLDDWEWYTLNPGP